MKKTAAPSKRSNDGHQYQRHSLVPFGPVLTKMAGTVLHDKVLPKDSIRRGSVCGAKRRFSEAEVRMLRERHMRGETSANLAREFGTHENNMRMIINGVSYAWVI